MPSLGLKKHADKIVWVVLVVISQRTTKKIITFGMKLLVNVSKAHLATFSSLSSFLLICFIIYYLYPSPSPFPSWTPGVWRGGKIHSLTWMERETSPKYSWEETLSFVRMEEWVSKAVEVSFVYALKSQLTCEVNYVTSSLSTLVCDCVGNGGLCSFFFSLFPFLIPSFI